MRRQKVKRVGGMNTNYKESKLESFPRIMPVCSRDRPLPSDPPAMEVSAPDCDDLRSK